MLKKQNNKYISPKRRAYRRNFDITKYIYFLMKDDELLQKQNGNWGKVKNSIKKEFDSEPVYNKKYLKAKEKSYDGKTDTNLHNKKIPKEVFQFICYSVIFEAS